MKTLITLFLMAIPSFLFSQNLNFDFFDSGGKSYNSTRFNAQLEKESQTRYDIRIILVETPDLNNPLFREQAKILNSIDAVKYRVAYIFACPKSEKKDGYHTSTETSKQLMNNTLKFRIRILNTAATVLKESWIILSSDSIKIILKK